VATVFPAVPGIALRERWADGVSVDCWKHCGFGGVVWRAEHADFVDDAFPARGDSRRVFGMESEK
jgi:hypothetical protein